MEASSNHSAKNVRQPIELEPGDALDVLQSTVNVLQRAGFRVVCIGVADGDRVGAAVIVEGVEFVDGEFRVVRQ